MPIGFMRNYTFFGKLDFEIAVGPIGQPSGLTFCGIFEVRDSLAPAWHHAQIWAPKIIISENRDCGCSTDRSRSLEYQGTLFSKSDEN